MNWNTYHRPLLVVTVYLASVVSLSPFALATTLTDLFGGASLDVGSVQFTDWELTSLDSLTLPLPDLGLIDVVPLDDDPLNPGVKLVARGELSTTGLDNINLGVKFKVSATPTQRLVGHELDLADVTFGGNDGIAFVTADITDGTNPVDSALVMADKESDFFLTPTGSPFAPKGHLAVEWDIFVTGFTGSVNLNGFTHRFAVAAIPEPTCVALASITALLALTARRK